MLEVIEKLLKLQGCDQQIIRTKSQLARIPIDCEVANSRVTVIRSQIDETQRKLKRLEAKRKELELSVVEKQQAIEKYTIQQYQTRKNEEYRALANEIQATKEAIVKIEDEILLIMEQCENIEKELKELKRQGEAIAKEVNEQIAELKAHEAKLQKELNDLQQKRETLASEIDASTLAKYERLLKNKGDNVVVGIDRGVCGGCHMRLSRQLVVDCQAQTEMHFCPNCGRIIYYSPDMDVAVVE